MQPLNLPEPLGGPLPLTEPGWLPWWAVAIALGLAFWMWRRTRRRVAAPLPVHAAPPPEPVIRDEFAEWVRELERRYLADKRYREGCHELSRGIRRHLEKQTAVDLEPLTADELIEVFADKKVATLAVRLRDARFGRKEPGKRQFSGLCSEANDVLGGGKRLTVRRGDRPPGS